MLKHLPVRRPAISDDNSHGLALVPEHLFVRMLGLERKRTERSGRSFILMLLDPTSLLASKRKDHVLRKLFHVLEILRETDIKGWYKNGSVIGAILTEIGEGNEKRAVQTVSAKVSERLFESLDIEEINHIRLSFHVFPYDWEQDGDGGPSASTLRLILSEYEKPKGINVGLKRMMDVFGSLVALISFLPIMLAIAVVIKLTSLGPIIFKQTRVGKYGKKFTFLKFRSMHFNNDPSIHQNYVRRFIAAESNGEIFSGQQNLYKMAADPRITPIGRLLRRTSLDELPQFFNVLRGDMSLVGPRPPVVYEVECYRRWHRQRLLTVKPGITGLWQVEGRSRLKFDDMVRLDIRYARSWSLWLDLKILAQTPYAVLTGIGAC